MSSSLLFHNGVVITLLMSFDVPRSNARNIEIHGTGGSLHVPDPNTFGGPVSYARRGGEGLKEVPLTHGYTDNMRAIGLADMADGIINDRPHRASGELAAHVLEVMLALDEANRTRANVMIKSRVEQPEALGSSLTYGDVH